MRWVLVALIVWVGCDNCPDGNAGDSLFCHAANCSAEETVCSGACSNLNSDRDNCGACGNQCGDGLVCSFGQCVEGCDNGLVNCAGTCTDPAIDEANCGGCSATDPSHTCRDDQTCTGGVCGCTQTDVVCGGLCTDPMTDNNHCGAAADCAGANGGVACGSQEACLNGVCTSTLIYRGSLPASTGRWHYQAQLGLAGANADCEAHFPGSAICPYDKLLAASMKATPETINAMDYNGNPVTEWWIDDPTLNGDARCQKNADMIPWTYQTADEGHVGRHATLNAATGAISSVIVEPLQTGCSVARFVPCCSLVTAP